MNCNKKNKPIVILCVIITVCLAIFSITVGSYSLSIENIKNIITANAENQMDINVFFILRLPRVIMGLIGGFALGVVGGVYQIIFKNPLASPDLTGVASGSSLGAAVAIIFSSGNLILIMTGAYLGGILSLVILLTLTKFIGSKNTSSYLLSGIIISALSNAGVMLLKSIADPESQLVAIELWIMGTLSTITLQKMLWVILPIVVPVVILMIIRKQILILSFGSENATAMGLSPKVWLTIILTFSTLTVAAVVSVTGIIGFIGLISPHIAFLLLKYRSGNYLYVCGLVGSMVLLISDMFARTVNSGAEVAVSIPIVLATIPILIILLYKEKEHI